MTAFAVRRARVDDHEAVTAFTRDTWPDREATDYLPEVFTEWVETDGPDQRTFVLEADGEVAGTCQALLLSDHEAWAQGMRVAPAVRGQGGSSRLNRAALDWAADRGATVCRNLVFSWNVAGLAASRGVGFDPAAEFRWAHPDPDADAPGGLRVVEEPAAAWTCWWRSDARRVLSGLALHHEETWALAELTRENLRRVAEDGRVLALQGGDGTPAFAARTRVRERGDDGELEAVYGATAWADGPAARALFAAVGRDAASVGADRTRVLIPETPRHVSDAAYAGVEVDDAPDFVMEADLSGR